MDARYAYSIDLDRCIGCRACTVACGTGNELAAGDAYIAISDIVERRPEGFWGSFAHRRCFHCGTAPCVAVCPTGALSKWRGLTAVAPEKCSGCGYCTDACPFGVPHVRNDQVSKCVGCLERVQDGHAPWCEQTCPSQAIRFGERGAVFAGARARVESLRARYPEAQVYGEAQLGGLGLAVVLLARPGTYGLPERPEIPLAVEAWQTVVRPASIGLTGLAAAAMGLTFIVARRQHARERAERAGPGEVDPASRPSQAGADGSDHE